MGGKVCSKLTPVSRAWAERRAEELRKDKEPTLTDGCKCAFQCRRTVDSQAWNQISASAAAYVSSSFTFYTLKTFFNLMLATLFFFNITLQDLQNGIGRYQNESWGNSAICLVFYCNMTEIFFGLIYCQVGEDLEKIKSQPQLYQEMQNSSKSLSK